MHKRIVIIQGHPDPAGGHFLHALAGACARGAAEAGHEVQTVDVARLEFPLLRTKEDFDAGTAPECIRDAQRAIAWAEHLVIFYPLWLGTMPALLKAFFEQTFRPGFAADRGAAGGTWKKRLTGRSARIVITMGMPALIYRWYFGAHSLKSLERNILGFAGIGPIRESLVGMVETMSDASRRKWLAKAHAFGRDGQ
ncbi:MAG: NAD(P)H-dependent oxidoreductase [Burkholderiales bacterium]|nr:NAD(P)H-dependent oxidoreductase [Burkholderiales bacterium]